MKKITILLLGMTLVINTAMSQRYQGELYAYQTGGDSETWVIEDWSTIYGYYEDGYPIETSGYHYVTNTGYNINANFGEGDDIYYGLYKLSVNGDYIYIDFRDCDYSNGDGFGTNYIDPDTKIEYFPATHNFKSYNSYTTSWRTISNHGTVRVWEDDRKTDETHPSSCFGVPDTPTGFDSSLESTGGGEYSPKLDWNANSNYDIDAYQLWRKIGLGIWSVKATISDPTTTYTDYDIVVGDKNTNYVYYKLRAKDWGALYSGYTGIETIRYESFSPVIKDNDKEINSIPEEFYLYPNYPNPFNPSTNVSFALPGPSHVTISIYNVTGKLIDQIAIYNLGTGKHSIQWLGNNVKGTQVATGIYILNIQATNINTGETYSANNKLHLMK